MPIIVIVLTIAALFGIGTYFLKPPVATTTPPVVSMVEEVPVPGAQVPTSSEPVTTPTAAPVTTTTVTTTTTTPTDPVKPVAPKPVRAPAPVEPTPVSPQPVTPPPVVVTTTFKDASYSATTNYNAPGRTNHIVAVNLSVKNDIVTAVSVAYSGDNSSESSQYQKRFSNSYQSQVVGKSLDSTSLSRVGGASLTTNAFNKALATIVGQARI